jgi:hypothetical protein
MMASGNRPEVQEGLCRLTIITRVPDMRDSDKSVVQRERDSHREFPLFYPSKKIEAWG